MIKNFKEHVESNVYFVYCFLDPRKPGYYEFTDFSLDFEPIYIGKGKGDRSHKHRNKTDIKTPKDKSRIIILHDKLSEVYAFILERYYIRWFGRKDNGTGILRNRTDGGDGTSGVIVSQETRKKLRVVGKGRIFSDETRKKLSIASKGKPKSPEHTEKNRIVNLGRKQSEESIKKKTKSYIIIDPCGNSFTINGMRQFCRDNNLNSSNMFQVAKGKINHYKGWKCHLILSPT